MDWRCTVFEAADRGFQDFIIRATHLGMISQIQRLKAGGSVADWKKSTQMACRSHRLGCTKKGEGCTPQEEGGGGLDLSD